MSKNNYGRILGFLLEEWKQNVALYIDQDKRGFDRIRMFLTVQAGLLIIFGLFWENMHDALSIILGLLIAMVAFFLTLITWFMSKRAHQFILLRKTQAILIEQKINALLGVEGSRTSDGAITTFTREHVAFLSDERAGEWKSLKDEIRERNDYLSEAFEKKGFWKCSMDHLTWLKWVHRALGAFWILVAAAIGLFQILGC